MKKRVWVIISLILLSAAMLAALSACSGIRTVYFTKQVYEIFLDESKVLTPEVVTSPRGKEYLLTSSNEALLSVNEDGKSVTAHKEDTTVTLTVTAGNATATAKILVFKSRGSETIPQDSDGKHLVFFNTAYGSILAQRIEDGKCATEPAAPKRPGYILFGWYTDEEFKNRYDFSSPVTENLQLYALWLYAEPEYKVTYIDEKPYISGFKYNYAPYEEVVLPEIDPSGNQIAGIKTSAFAENESITSVTIPASYTLIDDYAFFKCTALKSVTIGAGIERIGKDAFCECSALEEVTFEGEALTIIDSAAFNNCRKLTSVTLPDSVSELGASSFKECYALASANVPDALTKLEAETFAYTALTSIDLNNVASIGNEAFWGATKLATVSGADKVTEVGSYTFGSLKPGYEQYATAWLTSSGDNQGPGGKISAKTSYLGKVLLYVHYVETKAAPVYVRPDTVAIASQAFADVYGKHATAIFSTDAPPTCGIESFGAKWSSNRQSVSIDVDIIVPKGTAPLYTAKWLDATPDQDGWYVASTYSIALVQKIYTPVDVAFDGSMYYRYPLVKDQSYGYFSKIKAKNVSDPDSDPMNGLTYSESVYYVLDSYTGSAQILDINEAIALDLSVRGDTYVYYLERVSSYAFYKNESVQTVKLPNRTIKIDSLAFNDCQALRNLYMEGDNDEPFTPAYITSTTFNLLSSSFRIRVPQTLLGNYDNWKRYTSISIYAPA